MDWPPWNSIRHRDGSSFPTIGGEMSPLLSSPTRCAKAKLQRLIQVFLSLLLLILVGCDSGPGIPPRGELTRDEAWQFEVQYLADELANRHTNAFFHTPRSVFVQEAEALEAAVPTLANHEIAVEMMRLTALIGDAHTMLNPWSRLNWHRFPLVLQWFEDGLFVTQVAGSEHHALLGARLIQIGDRPVDEAMEHVRAVISHENDYWFRERAPDLAMTAEVLHALGVLPEVEQGQFVFDQKGARLEVDLFSLRKGQSFTWTPALEPSERPMYISDTEQFYWYRYLSESRTLYLNYNRCREISSFSFDAFVQDLFTTVDANPIDRFVVDLRLNAGGNSAIIRPLYEALRERPALLAPDRLFVIIGPRTFSSGVLNAIELDRNLDATLVGTPTGGSPNSYGEVRTFRLPYSFYEVAYSTKYFSLLDTNEPTLRPDLVVPLTSTDYFAAHDPVLETIVTAPSVRN